MTDSEQTPEEVTKVVKKRVIKKKPAATKRVYSGNMTMDSDLFKLKVANMKKFVSIVNKQPIFSDAEHCHFFRTMDSNGRKQTAASHVGGHTHDIEHGEDDKGNLWAKAGPARGSKYPDSHTHKVDYVRSDKIYRRKLNEEAQLAITNRGKI